MQAAWGHKYYNNICHSIAPEDGLVNRDRIERGFGLIEFLAAIVIIGILTAIMLQPRSKVVEDVRRVKTEREMEMLSNAIAGNPQMASTGGRTDFGYMGDIGAFPPNLDALISNPGGYTTWDGPYIPRGFVEDNTGFKTDEWGTAYSYSGGVTIVSSGSGTSISKKIASSTSDYLFNTLSGIVKDAADSLPGITYMDSVSIVIGFPNGSGGVTTNSAVPDQFGLFTFDSLPVGAHPLRVIYTPDVDTLFRYITIFPRHKNALPAFKFSETYFSTVGSGSGGLTLVAGTERVTGGSCDKIRFSIRNTTGSNIDVSSIMLTWSTPTSYYRRVKFDGIKVFDQNNPKHGSGETTNFSSTQTVAAGSTVELRIEQFSSAPSGGGKVNMSNASITVLLSDGSTFVLNLGACQ